MRWGSMQESGEVYDARLTPIAVSSAAVFEACERRVVRSVPAVAGRGAGLHLTGSALPTQAQRGRLLA